MQGWKQGCSVAERRGAARQDASVQYGGMRGAVRQDSGCHAV